MSEASAEAFFAWAVPATQILQTHYHLNAWEIALKVVPDEELSPRHAAEVSVREEYRAATIYLSESLILEADKNTILHVIDHELQHVVFHPLDALKSLVLDIIPDSLRGIIIPDSLRGVVTNELGRANERVRASLERLLLERA